MVRRLGFYLLVFLPLALAACSGSGNEDDVGNGANGTDPALSSALQDQIMVDPALGQQANGDTVRPPSQPYSGGVPADGVAAGGAADTTKLMHAPAPTTADKNCTQCEAARESVTLGGLGTAFGALVGSLIIGLVVELAPVAGAPGDLKYASALVILILLLMVRPQGILGRAERVG